MFNQDKSKYALVKVFGEYGYGHFYATIYNLTDRTYGGPQLLVTSQIGTSYDPPLKDQEIYAWRWGAAASHSAVSTWRISASASARVLLHTFTCSSVWRLSAGVDSM